MRYREMIRRKKKESKRSLDVIVRAVATGIFVASLLLNVVFLVLIVILGAALGTLKDRGLEETGYKKIYSREHATYPRGTGNELAVIRIDGLITEYDTGEGLFGRTENSVSAVSNRLSIIKKDRNIKGVLLLIESPGGSVSASDTIYHYIREFKEETGIPVVTLMNQVAASGAYYIASASDYIMASPTTITGSIGVILYSFNFKGLMDKYGVKYVAVKSGEFKDMISPFKAVEETEIAWMQSIVDNLLEKFVAAVVEGRPNLRYDQIKKLADGRVYIAEDAVKLGLIDSVGYYREAVKELSEKAGVLSPNVVEFQREKGFRDIFRMSGLDFRPRTVFDLEERRIPDKPFDLYFLWEGAAVF